MEVGTRGAQGKEQRLPWQMSGNRSRQGHEVGGPGEVNSGHCLTGLIDQRKLEFKAMEGS